MKKLITFLTAAMMIFVLGGCNSSEGSSANKTNSTSSALVENHSENGSLSQTEESRQSSFEQSTDIISEQTSETQSEPAVSENGKTLVVYFSASGNTKRVAEIIAQAAGADLFELVPVTPYTDADLNWRDQNSRVWQEHNDESLRDVPLEKDTVENWSEYNTVFVGYPIWWQIAAWAVDDFVENNDFSGKTVIPFCTSTSSGMGESGKLLAETAGTGNWLDGQRFQASPGESDVIDWVKGLDL